MAIFGLRSLLHRSVLVRTTVETRPQAEALARKLVDQRAAACVHVTELASTYRWQGRVTQETEFLVEARTVGDGGKAVERVAKAMLDGHPYQEPLVEVVSQGLFVNASYYKWMRGEVR